MLQTQGVAYAGFHADETRKAANFRRTEELLIEACRRIREPDADPDEVANWVRVNYRTSHQIRLQADCLLGPSMTDVDGNSEDRGDNVSVFDGPSPAIRKFSCESEESKAVAGWISQQTELCQKATSATVIACWGAAGSLGRPAASHSPTTRSCSILLPLVPYGPK
jgi:hypothetical protein